MNPTLGVILLFAIIIIGCLIWIYFFGEEDPLPEPTHIGNIHLLTNKTEEKEQCCIEIVTKK